MNINANRIVIVFAIINFLGVALINLPSPNIQNISKQISIPKNFAKFIPRAVDKDEQKCLQENIFFEARNQSIMGQLAVGIVTIERKNSQKFSDTICGVVFARKQFSWANKGRIKPRLKNKLERDAWDTAGFIAEHLLQADIDIPVFNMTYYHTTQVNPRWNRKMEVAMYIGDHIFYKEKDS